MTNDNDDRGGGKQATRDAKHFVFERRAIRPVNVVPVPVLLVALGCAVAAVAAACSPWAWAGWLAAGGTCTLAAAVQARAWPAMWHDAGRDVLCVRRGVSWTAVAGFRCTRLPTNVDGNQRRLLRQLHGIDPAVTFKIVVSRHEFPREARSGSRSWFAPGGDEVATLGAGESGHAWFLVLERPVNLLLGLRREVAALARARDATKTMFPNTYPHHQFRAATAGELAQLAAW